MRNKFLLKFHFAEKRLLKINVVNLNGSCDEVKKNRVARSRKIKKTKFGHEQLQLRRNSKMGKRPKKICQNMSHKFHNFFILRTSLFWPSLLRKKRKMRKTACWELDLISFYLLAFYLSLFPSLSLSICVSFFQSFFQNVVHLRKSKRRLNYNWTSWIVT